MHTAPLVRFLPLLALAFTPPPDEGWDLMVLDMPHRVVLGDDLVFSARCRPGNPYAVYGDVVRSLQSFPPVRVHLQGSIALFTAASGIMSLTGSAQHRIAVPNLPGLHGLDVHFQAFCLDGSIRGGIGGSDSKTVTLLRERGQPLVGLLTVNRIPRDFNGSEPNEGRLQVPPTGFSVDVFFDERGQGPIDPGSLVVTADQPLGAGAVPAGTNLAQFLTVGAHSATGIVDSRWSFPAGVTVSLTARVANAAGSVSPQASYTVDSVNFGPFNRPFRQPQSWWVDFDRHDLDRNGIPDYREDLVLFGLGSDPLDMSGPSFRVNQQARQAIIDKLRGHFRVGQPDGVRIDFFATNPGGTFATICVGGLNPFSPSQLPPGAILTTGAAFLNPYNRNPSIVNCNGLVGVHPRSIHVLFQNVPAFQTAFGPLLAVPVGLDPDDPVVTAPGFNPRTATTAQAVRWVHIQAGVEAFANSVAFILVQETCHSMGLVTGGRLPAGHLGAELYGHSTGGHTDDGLGNFMSGNNSTPAPATAANLALIWDHFQSGRAHFTELNWAYLRETIVQR